MTKFINPALPKDGDGRTIAIVPASEALAANLLSSLSTAYDHTLNADTSLIEISALVQSVYMKYGGTAGTADFDEFIMANTIRHYAIPDGVAILSFLEKSATAEVVLVEK